MASVVAVPHFRPSRQTHAIVSTIAVALSVHFFFFLGAWISCDPCVWLGFVAQLHCILYHTVYIFCFGVFFFLLLLRVITWSPTYILNEDTQPVIRAIGVSHTACKDEFRQSIRSQLECILSFIICLFLTDGAP